MEIVSADHFTFSQLTEAYNHTRVDYLVPMAMGVDCFKKYCGLYDVSLEASCVAVESNKMIGLGMLGLREGRSWITRIGVLPEGRRKGVGTAIMSRLLQNMNDFSISKVSLEVIRGNLPALGLFSKFGFEMGGELVVAKRHGRTKINRLVLDKVKDFTWLGHDDALTLLSNRKYQPSWLNETESMNEPGFLSALVVELKNGGKGWVTYHQDSKCISRIIVETEAGDSLEVTEAVLMVLNYHYGLDSTADNVCMSTCWPGFLKAGYLDLFHRFEMKIGL